MFDRTRGVALLGVSLLILLSVTTAVLQAEEEEFRETFNATAVAMGTSNPPVLPIGSRATLQINITRWTSDEERNEILTQLRENGQQGLSTALAKQPETGWVRVTSTTRGKRFTPPSERLRYARQLVREDGTRRIILAMDRPIGFVEAVSRPRYRDYDVTMLVLDVNKKGEGEGQLALGVRMQLDDQNNLKIENFGTEPVRLMNVRKR
jgi:predicted 2-oxoglutarate/Fe(II)-dependent dioxygenase YbiX